MQVGTVVWLNSGQGPFTILSIDATQATVTQGRENITFPLPCLSDANPNAKLQADLQVAAVTEQMRVTDAKTTVAKA